MSQDIMLFMATTFLLSYRIYFLVCNDKCAIYVKKISFNLEWQNIASKNGWSICNNLEAVWFS